MNIPTFTPPPNEWSDVPRPAVLGEATINGYAGVDARNLFTEEQIKQIEKATIEVMETGEAVDVPGLCRITPGAAGDGK